MRRAGAAPRCLTAFALAALFAFLALLLPTSAARATNAITGACSSSSTGVSLPAYDFATKAQQTGTGIVAVQCTGTGTVTVKVALTTGTGTCATRTMKNGSSTLNYNIYTTSAYATIWCDPTTRVSVTFTFSSTTIPQTKTMNVTMYVRVTSGQMTSSGTYSDSLGSLVYWTGGNSASSTFTVTESAPIACSAAVANLDFGTYTGAARTAQTSITVTCASGAAYTIALSSGSNYSGTTRRMKSPAGQFIVYGLYKDAALATPWGDGTTGGTTSGGTGNGAAQPYTVYGSAPAAPTPVPGSYSDAVIVTLTY